MLYLVGALFYTFIYAAVIALVSDEHWEAEMFGGMFLIWLVTALIWPFSLVALAAWGLVLLIKEKKKNDKVSPKS